MLTQADLKSRLDYCPITGVFRWKSNPKKAKKVVLGREITSVHSEKSPYIICRIDGVAYRAHRLAWLYMTGDWPLFMVDHKNGIRTDNRWHNLRSASSYQNGQNSTISKKNTSGYKGVFWRSKPKKWEAQIGANGKKIYLGQFDDISEAVETVRREREKLHGEYANHGDA